MPACGVPAKMSRSGRTKVSAPALSEGPMLHIDIPTLAEFKALAQIKGETCVSLYLPTSPLVDNIRANRVAFRDLAREALAQLREAGADKRKIAVFEERFDHLAGLEHDVQDEDKIRKLQRAKPDPFETFWHYQANGLGVLSTPADTRHDVAARYLRAGAGRRERAADPRLHQLSAAAVANSGSASECGR